MAGRLALLPLVALVATPAQAAPADPAAIARVKAVISSPLGNAGPGCAVGIFRNGRLAETVVAGGADTTTRRPIDINTQFYAASVSKQFTTIALMQLVVAKKVALTDSVRKYIPELKPYADKVTVQMLLNMTGGIRDSLSLLALEGYEDIAAPNRATALAGVYRQDSPKFEPGTQYDYTNGGFLLLSEIVERVAKTPFETYVNTNVLKPLGMTRSFVMLGKRTADPNVAHGYIVPDGKVQSADNYPLFGGSGGLITTIPDLAKWDHDIDSGHKVWTPEILKIMTTPGKFNNGQPAVRTGRGIAYGDALLIGPHWFHHTGGASGFKTLYGHLPEKRIGIGLLCNNGDIDPGPKADEVIAALNEGLPPIMEPSADGSAFSGRYINPNVAATYVIAANPDAIDLTIERADGQKRPITMTRGTDGIFKGGGMTITPDDDAQGFELTIPRVTLHFVRAQ